MENQRLVQLLSFLEQSPNDSFTRYSLGLEYLSQADYSSALGYFEQLLAQDPGYLATYYQLGRCLRLLQRDQEAMTIYKAGIEKARDARKQHTLAELQNALLNTELGEEP